MGVKRMYEKMTGGDGKYSDKGNGCAEERIRLLILNLCLIRVDDLFKLQRACVTASVCISKFLQFWKKRED